MSAVPINENSDHPSGRVELPGTLKTFVARFDKHLDETLNARGDSENRLVEAVRYAALAPGKRLRPFLLTRCCELAGGDFDDALAAAMAVECVHAFSLVHDDLPAMDDDDVRRGRPTCHRVFGDAGAILAGDALVVFAFEMLSRMPHRDGIADAARVLAEAAGWCGMIGGQAADLAGESQPPDKELVAKIHMKKTAALFRASCELGVISAAGNHASHRPRLTEFGQKLGHAFQIADDLLDVTANASTAGKSVGKDADAGKQTLVACEGVEKSRQAAQRLVDDCLGLLEPYGEDAEDLRTFSRFVVDRNY